jgi:Na+-driven multidrug efflux pump
VISVSIGRYGQTQLDWGLYGWWWILTGWLLALAAVYLARFLHGAWRSMRVIEAEYLPGAP